MVNALGRRVGLCQRLRLITPWRLALSVLTSFATRRVECLSDAQREYNRLFGTTVAYKPFYKRLTKAGFADFMRALTGQLLDQLRVQVLQAQPDGAFVEFDRIVIQDGSSFALKGDLADVYPGRFKTQSPAAAELHTTLELCAGTPSRIGLTPDTDSERAHLPLPETVAGSLLLADRGYFKRDDLAALDEEGASFVLRAYNSINPRVIRAFNGQGKRRPRHEGQPFKAVRRAPHRLLDLDVGWGAGAKAWWARLIVSGRPAKHQYLILVTNLSRSHYSAKQVQQAYQKVAKCVGPVLLNLFKALAGYRAQRIKQTFIAALDYLATNAQRAHPRRDRRTGRLQLGLETVMGTEA
jgi:hypothetical protein